MTPTPPLPPEDADVFSVENLRQGLKGCEAVYPFDQDRAYEGLRRWANLAADEIDRLAKRAQEAERERDELRAWKTATHEQWAAWTRDDFKARAEAAEVREAVLREALNDADGILQWFASNYPKAMREMPTSLWQRLEFIRAALATADPEASK